MPFLPPGTAPFSRIRFCSASTRTTSEVLHGNGVAAHVTRKANALEEQEGVAHWPMEPGARWK